MHDLDRAVEAARSGRWVRQDGEIVLLDYGRP